MVIGELQGKLGAIPGVKTFATAPPAIPIGAGEMPVEFVIKYPGDYSKVGEVLDKIDAEAKKSGLFIFTNTDLRFETPQAELIINKDKANQFIQFVKGSTSQDLFAQYGFRPVNKKILAKYASKYPARPGIFKVDDKIIGGWRNADKIWFDPNKGRMVAIERAIGGPSSG